MAARENIEQIEQQDKEEEAGTYPEDAIKFLDSEEVTETEKPKEEVPDKVLKLKSGTVLKGRELAKLINVTPSYLSKYKSGQRIPPAWFWENFEARGEGNKSRWVKK